MIGVLTMGHSAEFEYEIIEEANGKIWVESELGAGSKFIFTFPKTNSK